MDWSNDRLWFTVAVVLYGISTVCSIFLWRHGFRRNDLTIFSLLLTAFLPHTGSLIIRGVSLSQIPVTNLFEAVAFILWTMNAAYLFISIWSRLHFSGAFISPLMFCCGVFALMPELDQIPENPQFTGLVSLHATLILLSYGAFGLSATAGIMFLSQEHDLRHNKLRAIQSLLPSIEQLDAIAGTMHLIGIGLLTAGLSTTILIYSTSSNIFEFDAKIIWSAIVWIMYATLMLARWRFDLQGHRFAQSTTLAFVFVILTFWGTNLLSAIHQ